MNLQELYGFRFQGSELQRKAAIWQVLCNDFFSNFIRPTDTVVDIGAGYCEFINNIKCGKKIAVDLNPDIVRFANKDITIINENCTAISSLDESSVDAVFMSNFLEHLPSKSLITETLIESHRILKSGGKIIILQPNIRFVGGEYWDFFDHHTPLTDKSLVEVLSMCSFKITRVIPKFLPYTTKSHLPQSPWLVKMYIKLPLAWKVFGKQTLVIAEKSSP